MAQKFEITKINGSIINFRMLFKGLLTKQTKLWIQKFNLTTLENRYVVKLLEERGLLTGIFPNKRW